MKLMLVAALVMCGCDPTPRNKRIASAITLALSTAALACDAGQTISISRAGWPGGAHEGNWMMGPTPGTGTLVAYNTGVAGANIGAWFFVSEKYSWITPVALGLLETTLVAKNMALAPKPFCGIR